MRAGGDPKRRQVNLNLHGRIVLHHLDQSVDRLGRRRHARQSERDRVAEEDLGERFADDRTDPAASDRLRRVLARRSAAEVRVDDEDRRPVVAGIGKGVRRAPLRGDLSAIVDEEVLFEPLERDRLEIPRRNDAIGVDVVAGEGQRRAAHLPDLLNCHAASP